MDNLKIVYVPISELKPAAYNPRKWTKEQLEKLKESISRFGCADPIIANGAPNRMNVVIGFYTRGNKPLSLGNVYRTLQNTFYYGPFEFPVKSGNWYQGKHEPLVSKELFDKVQEYLKRDSKQHNNHEFAFTKLMICGSCGSCISGQEKYKPLKDGTTARYIYYGCGRTKDHHCKGNKYLREEELVNQLIPLIDKIDFNQFSMKIKFEEELRRFNKFQKTVLGSSDPKVKHEDTNPKVYAKYILKEGTNEEKRELLSCLKSKIELKDKIIKLV